MLPIAIPRPAPPYGSVGFASSAAASSSAWRARTHPVVCGTITPLPYGCAPSLRSASAFCSRRRIWSSMELVIPGCGVSAMGTVSLPFYAEIARSSPICSRKLAPMPSRKGPTRWRRLALAAAVCAAVLTGVFWASLPSAETLRSGNPSSTALIDARAREARRKGRPARRNQHWAALKSISPWLRDAVVNSEDARFYEHQGVDAVEMRAALAQAVEEGRARGASTLNQQLAKNLWLGEERSLLRKLKEVVLARRLEALGKDRVLELYLNVAEWGNGVYGADAAARVWFRS